METTKFPTITGQHWKEALTRTLTNDVRNQLMEIYKSKIQQESEKQESQEFIIQFNRLQREVNQTAHDKGWYQSDIAQCIGYLEKTGMAEEESKPLWKELQGLEDARRISLIHSELSEGLEGLRAGNPPSDKIGDKGFSQIEEEFADAIIRIMDMSQERGWRIAEAIEAKREYNKGRAHRHGGKAF